MRHWVCMSEVNLIPFADLVAFMCGMCDVCAPIPTSRCSIARERICPIDYTDLAERIYSRKDMLTRAKILRLWTPGFKEKKGANLLMDGTDKYSSYSFVCKNNFYIVRWKLLCFTGYTCRAFWFIFPKSMCSFCANRCKIHCLVYWQNFGI